MLSGKCSIEKVAWMHTFKVWYFEIAGKEFKQAEKRIGLETS
jgi:hypothetical protein